MGWPVSSLKADKTSIDFTIHPDGSVSFEVKGTKGADCLELTREIEEELGLVTSREKTSEYYEESVSEQDQVLVAGAEGDEGA